MSSEQPDGLDPRRLGVYRELVFNNIESLLSNSYPVLKSILGDGWVELVNEFISVHRAQTRYFTQLPREFYHFIQHQQTEEAVPLFVGELAHHELLELELLYRQVDGHNQSGEPATEAGLALSPLAEITRYRYPVHRLSALHLPEDQPEEPTHILQFRNPEGKVVFMQLSAFAYQLLSLISLHPGHPGDWWLESLAESLTAPALHDQIERFKESGRALLDQLFVKGVLFAAARNATTQQKAFSQLSLYRGEPIR